MHDQRMRTSYLPVKHSEKMAVTDTLFRQRAVEGDDFLFNIVTGDESWFRHFDPEIKRQSMEWHRTTSPKKKPKTVPLARKVTGTDF
jgi:hypothetical protein